MFRLLIPLCLIAASPLAARDAAPPGPVASLAAALQLYDAGAAAGDALQMAVAARMAAAIRLREAGHWQREAGPAASEAPPPAGRAPAKGITLDLLRSEAAWSGSLVMAEEDELLGDLLAELVPPVERGSASRADDRLEAGQSAAWRIPFDGQVPAELAVFEEAGPDSPGLSWRVEDAAGQVICPEQRHSFPACRFTPEANGFFRIVVTNRAAEAASYALLSN